MVSTSESSTAEMRIERLTVSERLELLLETGLELDDLGGDRKDED